MKRMIERLKAKLATSVLLALFVIGIGAGVFAQADGPIAIYLPALANSASDEQSRTDSSADSSVDQSSDEQGSDDPYEALKQRAIDLLAAHEDMALYLAGYSGWVGNAWQNDDDSAQWQVNFVLPTADGGEEGEWLGDGEVNIETGEILWAYAPRELTTEEFQSGLQQVEALVERDPEVQAMLGEPDVWEHDTYYNRWEQYWETSYWYGLETIIVRITIDEERAYIDAIYDPNEFDAAEKDLLHRNQAIEVAYEANGIDLALDNVDNWRTYVEIQGESQYSVEFVADGKMLFYALVDVEAWSVINSQLGHSTE